MSVSFPFPLPTTGILNLSEYYRSIDFQQVILNSDGARAAVRDALKSAKRAQNPDILGIVKAIEEYLPFVMTISGDHGQFLEPVGSQQLAASWRMPLKTSKAQIHIIEAPRVELTSFEFERGMVLLTYALALMALAEKAMARKESGSDRYKLANAYLGKAQSVLVYLSAHPPNMDNVPVDLQNSSISGLISLLQGSLHLLILYKSLEEEASTSPSLLSRVAIYAAEKFRSSLQLFTGSKKTGSDALRAWLNTAHNYCMASAQMYMAIDTSSRNNIGQAVGLLELASETLSIKKHTKILSKDKDLEKLEDHAQLLKAKIDETLDYNRAENDRITFQPVPSVKDLKEQQNWPSGREVTAAKPWNVPKSLIEGSDRNEDYPSAPSRSYF
ncbi:hypothetical protein TRVA0_003S04038 [Trichomonascus vanleenenianus]|uniref:uncharacterized protein n=1 Tax=Trichomonascus vanleenenianus TaxID=2268995 RepID=UPI003ECAFDDF